MRTVSSNIVTLPTLQTGHLKEHLIDTIQPEEIRGGGLLKYTRLLASGYTALYPSKLARMERYMCSRFFIDFPDIDKQGTVSPPVGGKLSMKAKYV